MKIKNVISLFLSALFVGTGISSSAIIQEADNTDSLPKPVIDDRKLVAIESFTVRHDGKKGNYDSVRAYATQRLSDLRASVYNIDIGSHKAGSRQMYFIYYYR